MPFSSNAFVLLLVFVIGANTDFLGPTYPAPRDLSSSDSLVRVGWDNLTSTLEQYLKGNHDAAAAPLSGVVSEIILFNHSPMDSFPIERHLASVL